MNEKIGELQNHLQIAGEIGDKIEQGQDYMEQIRAYLPALNEMILWILQAQQKEEGSFDISQEYVVQVLNDIMYGIENQDSVFLLDVWRYGLLGIYTYIIEELQNGESV